MRTADVRGVSAALRLRGCVTGTGLSSATSQPKEGTALRPQLGGAGAQFVYHTVGVQKRSKQQKDVSLLVNQSVKTHFGGEDRRGNGEVLFKNPRPAHFIRTLPSE